jgi:predicted AAA+ superfamily ATPase
LLVIDEVQRVPDLLLAIKHEVDLDPRPGRFLLTGSARLFALHDIPDLLPGRSETIELWPLSQGELDRSTDGFVDALFDQGVELVARESGLTRDDYLDRALCGGYPEAVRRTDLGRRARFFESYISDLINRDVRQVSQIERPEQMRRLLNLVAASMASLTVPAARANQLQLPASTVKRYLDLLELLFVVRRIPAWSTKPHDPSRGHTQTDHRRSRACRPPCRNDTETGEASDRARGSAHRELRDRRAGPAAQLGRGARAALPLPRPRSL